MPQFILITLFYIYLGKYISDEPLDINVGGVIDENVTGTSNYRTGASDSIPQETSTEGKPHYLNSSLQPCFIFPYVCINL